MLQYLLNATAIWLLSLLMYELLLRRESFHNYNRFYLLFTFVLGALFPLVQTESYTGFYSDTHTVQKVVSVKQNIVSAATVESTSIGRLQWVWIIYLTGVVISSTLLLIEAVKLIQLYRKGNKKGEGIFIVIETGKVYAPFSIFNLLFVNSRAQYNTEEWNTIIAHEKQHTRLVHFVDILLMQFGRILFWFHPLVYIYNKRLLMVHEYQADNIAKQAPQEYGQFLLEQSLLQSAPALSHSFNRSPIKNRIVMLTRTSSRAARIKTLVFLPLIFTCIVCFAQSAMKSKASRKGDVISYNGNQIGLSKQMPDDTVYMEDPVTNKMEMKIAHLEQHPITLNGEKLYMKDDGIQTAKFAGEEGTLLRYLYKNAAKQLDMLPEGEYTLDLDKVVIDAKGKLVYYEYGGLNKRPSSTGNKVPENIKKTIDKRMTQLLDKVTMKPAQNDGKKLPYYFNELDIWRNPVKVSAHKASY